MRYKVITHDTVIDYMVMFDSIKKCRLLAAADIDTYSHDVV